jgi:hypothetical protein
VRLVTIGEEGAADRAPSPEPSLASEPSGFHLGGRRPIFAAMQKSTRWSRVGIWAASAALLGLTSFARPASAHSYFEQPLTLRSSNFELGLGLGLGHLDVAGYTGLGINLEIGYGVTPSLEFRFRTGLRLGLNGRVTDADRFGRPFFTETYNLGNETVANPQLGLRFLVARSRSLEVGVDAHAILPLSGDFGLLVGVPLLLRLGDRLRIDTGLLVPIVFGEPEARFDISIPIHVWLQVNSATFLGPMTGVYFVDQGGGERIPFGFGVGTSIAYDAEVRFWVLFPDISNDGDRGDFGLGVGLYVLF